MNSVKNRCMELREQDSMERHPKKLLSPQTLRPQICYVLSLLRIHSPDCEHCMARLTCGDDLRERSWTGGPSCLRTRIKTIEDSGEPGKLSIARFALTTLVAANISPRSTSLV